MSTAGEEACCVGSWNAKLKTWKDVKGDSFDLFNGRTHNEQMQSSYNSKELGEGVNGQGGATS